MIKETFKCSPDMIVSCRSIMELPVGNRLKLLTNDSGLDRQIRWVHYMEEPKYLKFIKGGELILTTGLLLGNSENMLEFIRQLHVKGVPGLVISLNRPFHKIDDLKDVIELGNHLKMSIFMLPWEIGMADLMQSICQAIFTYEMRRQSKENIMRYLLSDEFVLNEKSFKTAQSFGYDPNIFYCSAVIRIKNLPKTIANKNSIFSAVVEEFYNASSYLNKKILHLTLEDDIILMIPLHGIEDEDAAVALLKESFRRVSIEMPDLKIAVGIGNRWEKLNEFKDSLEKAYHVLKLIHLGEENISCFKDLDLFRLLCYINNPEEIRAVYSNILGPLIDYDNQNNTNLKSTIKALFQTNCKLAETADTMFIHINTLRYRMRRAEEILQCDLRNQEDLFRLNLALKLEDFLACQ